MKKDALLLLGLIVFGLVALRMFHLWDVKNEAIAVSEKYCDPARTAFARDLNASVDLKLAKLRRKKLDWSFDKTAQQSASREIQVIEKATEIARAKGCFKGSVSP